jgi:PAT family beta-lactamase induction signal transducer AmpG
MQASPHSPDASSTSAPKLTWAQTLKVYLEPASLRMLSLGFSAGLPLLLVFGTLSFWLREAGIDRTTIGFLSWVGLAYGFKWVWSPLVDRMPIPWLTRTLGRRRSWLLASQAVIMLALVSMAMTDPQQSLAPVVWCAIAVAFGSATQDIALDAFRIESADTEHQAALAATYQTGYRLAMIWSGAGALWIAARAEIPSAVAGVSAPYQHGPWQIAYLVMAVSMLPGVLTVLFSQEPFQRAIAPSKNMGEWLRGALVEPFADFIGRYRWQAALILGLIATYRISDVVMGIMANPFYVDMGFSKDEVAAVTKVYGVAMTLVGAFVGGVLSLRMGVMRVLMLGAILSAASNLLFAWLSTRGHDVTALVWVVSADNLAGGIASSAFIAYLSSLTNVQYSATQYALFSSMMLLLPKFVAGFSGKYVDAFGYADFFTSTALLGVPVLILVALASRTKTR